MNIVIPMAGSGSRFEKAGYTDPKPFIPVNGKPMIRLVVDNLNIQGRYIFIAQKAHCQRYPIEKVMTGLDHKVIEIEGITEGAACTVLLAKDLIDPEDELIIANSDQLVLDKDYMKNGIAYFRKRKAAGGIWCFLCNHPKWSYAKIDAAGLISEVAEKVVISDLATVGIYYFEKGKYFIDSANSMIRKNIRVKQEFYVCPVFNELIKSFNKTVVPYVVNEMIGLGTPEDLKSYLEC